jgi:glycosyltransferase involved in cell wall biosynthesis
MFTVMYHSLLIGAALFVPIPFLDDRMATFLWKHMVSDLAKIHKRELTREQLLAFSYASRFGLSDGCLFVIKRLFREVLQEILFFLEWRRAINLAADAYYSGYLLNELFAYEGFDASKAGQYAVAMQKAKLGINTKLVQGVFRGTFRSGKGLLASIVKWLSSITVGYVRDSWLRRKSKRNAAGVSEQQMENFFEMHRSRFQTLLKDLIASLQAGIGDLPQEHFEELRNKMFEEVRRIETT